MTRPRHVGTVLLAALVCAFLIAVVSARAPQRPWAAQIDAVFHPWNGKSSPGCAVGVYKDGRLVFDRGYGMADLEHDVPIDADSVFYIGSVAKQFTAFTAALAIQQGRLSPDDSVRKFLPELPAYADAITIRHLIHHTSGLRDYNTLLAIAGRRGDEAYDNPTVLRITARQKRLNFSPGDEYLYSNTGYTLLATVVERATRTPFATFAETNIFKPLGMDATHYHMDAGRLVKRRALGYVQGSKGEWRLDTPSNERAGAGGLYTSVRDLLRWDENFYRPTVGSEPLIRQIQTPGPFEQRLGAHVCVGPADRLLPRETNRRAHRLPRRLSRAPDALPGRTSLHRGALQPRVDRSIRSGSPGRRCRGRDWFHPALRTGCFG